MSLDLPDFVHMVEEAANVAEAAFTPTLAAPEVAVVTATFTPIFIAPEVTPEAFVKVVALAITPTENKPKKRRVSALSSAVLDVPDLSFLQVKPARETRNGVMRPEERTVTGIVWDIAQALMQYRAFKEYSHTIPLVHEVVAGYRALLKDEANNGTCSTQYHAWVKFHDYRALVDGRRINDEHAATSRRQRLIQDKQQAFLKKKEAAFEKAAKKTDKVVGARATPKTRNVPVTVQAMTPQLAEVALMHAEDLHALTLHTPPVYSYEELVALAKQASCGN